MLVIFTICYLNVVSVTKALDKFRNEAKQNSFPSKDLISNLRHINSKKLVHFALEKLIAKKEELRRIICTKNGNKRRLKNMSILTTQERFKKLT